jgi:GH35 family endo-1,4-beta-xylanase
MHVSCYENADVQKSKQEHVVAMLELMAETGKLVKISELDMGYVDANGNTVPTTSMTEAQHQAMAAYYQFIVSKYFEIIPAAQRYGITQWCLTDAPGELGTGWRGGEPVGLWDQNYNRKHTYAGFAAGLQGK